MNKVYNYKEKSDSFIRKCPGSPNRLCCDYYIISPAYGCVFDCSYCFMHAYFDDFSKVTIFNNEKKLLSELCVFLETNKDKKIRLGSGEFTDSLAISKLDSINKKIIKLIANYNNTIFEFKTKSNRIDILLNIKAIKNIVLAWSLNIPSIIEEQEHNTANLEERLNAAKLAEKHGYKLAFHFDPIFMTENNLSLYLELATRIINSFSNIAWISMGGFRYTEELKLAMLYKNNSINVFNNEFVKCSDNKYRYPKAIRIMYYNKMANILNSKNKIKIYTCMESKDVWELSCFDNAKVLKELSYL
jgi:spore photoproduct lyase